MFIAQELRKTNIHNKSRMIAGYCYPWNSKKDKKLYDIILRKSELFYSNICLFQSKVVILRHYRFFDIFLNYEV